MNMRQVVIVDGVRTPIGAFGGSLRDVHAADLGALVIREALRRSRVEPAWVDDVIMGCVGQVAESAFIARMCALRAGLPVESNAYTVNRLCGSGLQAILSAAQAIRAGDADVVLAGGTENMSQLPYYVRSGRWGNRLGHQQLEDGVLMALTDPFGPRLMGVTAEAVAAKFGISREEQDRFALLSQQRAIAAIDAGRFRDEVVPVEVPGPKGETRIFATDEYPRRDTTLERLARLKPAFQDGGTVTAGNSSGINDGAAAVVVTYLEKAQELGLTPRMRLVSHALSGIDPLYMGYAPSQAIRKAVERAGLTVADLDVVELNEAFAAQALAVIRDVGLDLERTNPNGGAIALGHPIGATGAILTVKLMYELERRRARFGLVTMCIGGGQGIAAIFERL